MFVTRLQNGERMTDLCKEFGISRKTGYKLLERFQRLGPTGLFDVSRRPHRLAREKPHVAREIFIQARKEHPTWGAKKLRGVIQTQQPELVLPAASTIGDWLTSAGLVTPRKRRKTVTPYNDKLRQPSTANEVWCVDYKGQFRMGNGKYCYPLTVTDHFSRYILACEGFERIDGERARAVFEQVFATYGMPEVIRSDNGSPFASRGLLGLSKLSVWWLKLGITPERIEPGHPEQNGRHERMHRTLKAETTQPAGATLLQQQERFDEFVEEFNGTRPHEALGQKRPVDVHQASPRAFSGSPELEYPLHDDVIRVSGTGHARVLRRRRSNFWLSSALAYERVGVREMSDGKLRLTFANLHLGVLDPTTNRFHPADVQPAIDGQEVHRMNQQDSTGLHSFFSPPNPPTATAHDNDGEQKLSPMSPV
jgi:transposase InsO family protein